MKGVLVEYFIMTTSFAAPFFSDTSNEFVEASSPTEALEKAAASYKHPCGLFGAVCYTDANAYHKGEKPLAKWLCNFEIEKEKRTAALSGYSFRHDCDSNGEYMEVNGEKFYVEDPRSGKVVL